MKTYTANSTIGRPDGGLYRAGEEITPAHADSHGEDWLARGLVSEGSAAPAPDPVDPIALLAENEDGIEGAGEPLDKAKALKLKLDDLRAIAVNEGYDPTDKTKAEIVALLFPGS